MLDVSFQCGAVDMAARDSQLEQRIHLAIWILAGEGEQRPYQLLLDARSDRAHHPEIDDADPLPRLDEEIAGVGIGMKEAVSEDHLEHHACAVHRHPAAIEPGGIQGGKVIDLDAIDPLQGEHPIRRLFPEHAREGDGLITGKIGAEALSVPPLLDVIGLGPQRMRKLVDQADDVVLLRHRPAPAGVRGQIAQDLQVLFDLVGDGGPLHLHHHRGAVSQGGGVHLADRRRRQWSRIETAEQRVDWPVEFRLDH